MIEDNDAEKNINISIQNKEQLISFETALTSLQEKLDAKDRLINNINKEKERILSDLKKYKRANCNLKQQLEDERAYYLKEKEYYCKEMSVNKKMQKNKTEQEKSSEDLIEKLKEFDCLKEEVSKLKSVLNETLEANYNLSIKFLRMKNTKYTLKARFKKDQTENAKIISDLTKNLITLKEDTDFIIQNKFKEKLSPSNKKYLQVLIFELATCKANETKQLHVFLVKEFIECFFSGCKAKHTINIRQFKFSNRSFKIVQRNRAFKSETSEIGNKFASSIRT